MTSLFKTKSGKKQILDFYDLKLKELNIPFTAQFIDTSYGKTHILETGNKSKPKLILVHGSNGNAPIALETYSELLNHFHVIAIDVLAQPNKSETNRLNMKDTSYGIWITEIIQSFGFKEVYMAGFSFGGLIIIKTLEHNTNLIKHAFLTAPAYIVNGNPIRALFNIFLPMKSFMRNGNPKKLKAFLNALFTNPDDYAFNFLSVVLKEFDMDFSPIPTITKTQAKNITTPITIFAAKQDIIFPGKKMIKRAKNIFPNICKTVLLEKSKHVQNQHQNIQIQNEILEILNK